VVPGPARLTLRAHTTLIIALSALGVRCRAHHSDLAELDAALLEREEGCEILPRDPHGSFYLIELSICPPAASLPGS
jgi:hypothetical protein